MFFLACASVAAGPARASATPAALANLQSFQGRITYSAHRLDGSNATPVAGSLTVTVDSWTLEERGRQVVLHASSAQSWMNNGSQSVVFDDPFAVGALVNSWAALLGASAGASLTPSAAGPSWNSSAGLRFYLDSSSSQVLGVADSRSNITFAYSNWVEVNGVRLPQSILRLRDGVEDASFLVDGYAVEWAPKGPPATTPQKDVARAPADEPGAAVIHTPPARPWQPYAVLFMLFVLGVGVVAWTRRDVLGDRLIRHLSADPRGWRDEGTTVLVSPEGVLHFEGRPYFVGAAFYNEPTTVQSSPLFIRISSPQVPRVLIVARKFARPAILGRQSARARSAGFTLVEALTAMALFAGVIVAVVFPALVALSQADRLAQQRQVALQIAKNALVDEEAALEYGSAIDDRSVNSTVNGMKVTVTISASAIAGAHDLSVAVTDSSERTLARMATLVGPPVPAPGTSTPPPSR